MATGSMHIIMVETLCYAPPPLRHFWIRNWKLQTRAPYLVVRPRAARGQVIHVSPVLQQLHWLPIRQRIQVKICVYCIVEVSLCSF